MSKHRWDGPHEWLEEKMKTWDGERCREELYNLVCKLDADVLQDEYQAEMDADDYFKKHLEESDVRVGMRVLVLAGTGNECNVGEEGEVVERGRMSEKSSCTVKVQFEEGEGGAAEWFSPDELAKA